VDLGAAVDWLRIARFDADERAAPVVGYLAGRRAPEMLPIFIHVPRAAGASVCAALGRRISHHTLRYYENRIGPQLRDWPSFTILRDPVSRCLSAYGFVVNRGTELLQLNRYWSRRTRDVVSFEDYVEFLWRNRARLDGLDHVMRPQSYYVRGAKYLERPRRTFLLELDHEAINRYVALLAGRPIPKLNGSTSAAAYVSPALREQIGEIYRCDFELMADVAGERLAERAAPTARPGTRAELGG
jgi:hypothetical protein